MKCDGMSVAIVIINILLLTALVYTICYAKTDLGVFVIGSLLANGFVGASIWLHVDEQFIIDRFMLTTYLYVIVLDVYIMMMSALYTFLGLLSIFFSLSDYVDFVLRYMTLPFTLSFNIPELFYIILLAVGIYTTYATPAGFIGVIGKDTRAIEKISRILLDIAIAIGLITLFCPDTKKALWIGSVLFGIIYMFAKRQTRYLQCNAER